MDLAQEAGMGYYTQYSVKQLRNAISGEALAALVAGDEGASEALQPDGDTKRFVKWYDHEGSLCAWSSQYPGTIFLLHADGEDADGIWDKYFFGGKLLRTELFNGLPETDIDSLIA